MKRRSMPAGGGAGHVRVLRFSSALGALMLAVELATFLPVDLVAADGSCVAAGGDGTAPADTASHAGAMGSSTEQDIAAMLTAARLIIPVAGVTRQSLHDSFNECRGMHRHEAIDIAAPYRTPVIAVGEGRVAKLFDSVPGGLTIYQFDPDERFAYYYAHLDAYAPGLSEGAKLERGDLLGYVGVTGNAAAGAPHLHFAIFRLGPDRHWWQGEAVNPYPFLDDANR